MEILKSNKSNIKIAYKGFLYTLKKNMPEPYTGDINCSNMSSPECFANFNTSLDFNILYSFSK